MLACTDPYIEAGQIRDDDTSFFAKVKVYMILKRKESMAQAIQTAEQLFKKNKDTVLIRIMENITRFHTTSRAELQHFITHKDLKLLESLIGAYYIPICRGGLRVYLNLFDKQIPISQIQKYVFPAMSKQSKSKNLPAKRS